MFNTLNVLFVLYAYVAIETNEPDPQEAAEQMLMTTMCIVSDMLAAI